MALMYFYIGSCKQHVHHYKNVYMIHLGHIYKKQKTQFKLSSTSKFIGSYN